MQGFRDNATPPGYCHCWLTVSAVATEGVRVRSRVEDPGSEVAEPESLSNRRDFGPIRTTPGIDRLSLSFPLAQKPDWDRFETVTMAAWGQSASSTVKWNGVGVYVGAMEAEGASIPWGKVEFNPSRFVDPDGCELATVEDTHEAAQVAETIAGMLVEPAAPCLDWKVKRIDVARDFRDVSRPSLYVHGLAPLRRPYANYSAVFTHPRHANVQSLTVGSGAGLVRLYDQHEAYAERGAPEGSLRWECEAREDWSTKHRMEQLRDVTAEHVMDLTAYRWEWSACGMEVQGVDAVIEKVLRSELSPARQQRLLGVLMLKARGYGADLGRRQEREYERVIRELGVVLSPGALEDSGFTARLDYEMGTEVLRAA